ncbi:hypothetical protein, partial [Methylicorpusculum sp.]|uniref:hypothetical protein n=1 Tax=Methylicorpusculum sp. TaxID=2713644 RepID=UPI002AC92A9E
MLTLTLFTTAAYTFGSTACRLARFYFIIKNLSRYSNQRQLKLNSLKLNPLIIVCLIAFTGFAKSASAHGYAYITN